MYPRSKSEQVSSSLLYKDVQAADDSEQFASVTNWQIRTGRDWQCSLSAPHAGSTRAPNACDALLLTLLHQGHCASWGWGAPFQEGPGTCFVWLYNKQWSRSAQLQMSITSKISSSRQKIHGKRTTKDYNTRAYRVTDRGINRLALCGAEFKKMWGCLSDWDA